MSPRCLRLRPFVRLCLSQCLCLCLRLRLNIAFFFVFYVRLRSFSTFLGYFGVFLGILEYILPMFANVRLRSLFGMGIMFVFVFVSFSKLYGLFVFVFVFVLDHGIMFVFVFVSSMLTKLDEKTSLTFDNEDTSNAYSISCSLICMGLKVCFER